MISTASESEMIVEPERKRRRTKMQKVKLFTDISFLISKDYHPDPYGLSTASEDSEEEKDRFIEISIILKLITGNNGSILWTANKRKIQKARRVTYIARKPEITNMSVYCVVINIPVEPPSCHFA